MLVTFFSWILVMGCKFNLQHLVTSRSWNLLFRIGWYEGRSSEAETSFFFRIVMVKMVSFCTTTLKYRDRFFCRFEFYVSLWWSMVWRVNILPWTCVGSFSPFVVKVFLVPSSSRTNWFIPPSPFPQRSNSTSVCTCRIFELIISLRAQFSSLLCSHVFAFHFHFAACKTDKKIQRTKK